MAPTRRGRPAQVAQYVSVAQDVSFIRDKLAEHVRQEVWQRFGNGLPPGPEKRVNGCASHCGQHQAQRPERHHAFQALAELPLPIYLTTNPDDMMGDTLHGEARIPSWRFAAGAVV